jgi:uroporphyrin-III C-methyltransferase/precorrin-2 dehydrogenase/sirohydrochlorin ferrochelatase
MLCTFHSNIEIDIANTMPSPSHLFHLQPPASEHLGRVDLVGAGPGDPDLLTLKAHRLISNAQCIVHDRLIAAPILALAPAQAQLIDVGKQGFGTSWSQSAINALLLEKTAEGIDIVRLKSGDATLFGRLDEETATLDDAGIAWSIVPGITAASAASAAIGQSLTSRHRNSTIQFLTGHDVAGFAQHDWRTLARPGTVAAIYMGIRAARFLQGHLLMQGAAASTPVSIIEFASRPEQRILAATLGTLSAQLNTHHVSGPAVLLYGLAPRQAAAVDLPLQRIAS